jgi:hypothetical protein
MKRVFLNASSDLCSVKDRIPLDCPVQVNRNCGLGCAWFALTVDDLNLQVVNVWCKDCKIGYISVEDMLSYEVIDDMATGVKK